MDHTLNTNSKSAYFVAAALLTAAPIHIQAGTFTFAGQFPSSVTYPTNFSGAGGTVPVNVCIVPGTPNASNMEQSVRNNIAVWNKLQSTSSNTRDIPLPSNTFDFESVSLHEIGHCIGLGHPNLGVQTGVSGTNTNFTASLNGPDNIFGFGAGADSVKGSADDVRGDDVNLHFFNPANNNPFSESKIIDSSSYSRDVAMLPTGDLYPANADRNVSALTRYKAPFTEASMQQGTFNAEMQRTLGHDDVATIRFGKSGLDQIQGNADDYTINITYGGISDDAGCDINIAMDAGRTGFAVCSVSASFLSGNLRINTANIFFNPNNDWYFNSSAPVPCSESVGLTPSVWKMVSLPCQVGISTSATVADVFGDDLGTTNYETNWIMYGQTYTDDGAGNFTSSYVKLALTDELENEKGYWIITNEAGKTIDVEGEYNSQMDAELFVDSANMNNYGWNLIGMPFRFPIAWADTKVVDTNGDILSLIEADPISAGELIPGGSGTACSDSAPPAAACKVAQFAFVFNEATGVYDIKSTTAGTVDKFDAAWVFAGGPDYALRFPMSATERTTP